MALRGHSAFGTAGRATCAITQIVTPIHHALGRYSLPWLPLNAPGTRSTSHMATTE